MQGRVGAANGGREVLLRVERGGKDGEAELTSELTVTANEEPSASTMFFQSERVKLVGIAGARETDRRNSSSPAGWRALLTLGESNLRQENRPEARVPVETGIAHIPEDGIGAACYRFTSSGELNPGVPSEAISRIRCLLDDMAFSAESRDH